LELDAVVNDDVPMPVNPVTRLDPRETQTVNPFYDNEGVISGCNVIARCAEGWEGRRGSLIKGIGADANADLTGRALSVPFRPDVFDNAVPARPERNDMLPDTEVSRMLAALGVIPDRSELLSLPPPPDAPAFRYGGFSLYY
jgi:hypothetical protein